MTELGVGGLGAASVSKLGWIFFWGGGGSHSPAFLQASFLFCGLAPQPLLLTRTKSTVVGEKSHPAVFRNWEITFAAFF